VPKAYNSCLCYVPFLPYLPLVLHLPPSHQLTNLPEVAGARVDHEQKPKEEEEGEEAAMETHGSKVLVWAACGCVGG